MFVEYNKDKEEYLFYLVMEHAESDANKMIENRIQ